MQYSRIGSEYAIDDEYGQAIEDGMTFGSLNQISNGITVDSPFVYESNYTLNEQHLEVNITLTDNTSTLDFVEYKDRELEFVDYPLVTPSDEELRTIADEINDRSEAEALEQFTENYETKETLEACERRIIENVARIQYHIPDFGEITPKQYEETAKHISISIEYIPAPIVETDDVLEFWEMNFQ